MKTSINNHHRSSTWPVGLLVALGGGAIAHAAPPINALPVPEYSFDLNSPKVQAGGLAAGDILELAFPDPAVVVARAFLGLNSINDDLDALSGPNPSAPPGQTFLLLFSVDRPTVGVAPPDPLLAALEVPYNVADQAQKIQAAGDQFMSSGLFSRSTLRQLRGLRSGNNTLNRNNFDEGGTDFSADPPTSAQASNSPFVSLPQDNVDATAHLDRSGPGGAALNVYFSVTAASPSLSTLPNGGPPSGANIFFNASPDGFTPTTLFAGHTQLGLVAADDIDVMIVFDPNTNGAFGIGDQVLFSLTAGSPSLDTIPGASSAGAGADVFLVQPGQGPIVFAAASLLGLGDVLDNLDALDFSPCGNPVQCAVDAGIRRIPGDWDDNGTVNLNDHAEWDNCMTGPGGGILPGCDPFDFGPGPDIDVDLDDFRGFQLRFDIP